MVYPDKNCVGLVFPTKNYGEVTVLEYKDSRNLLVRFNNTDNEDWFSAGNISTGKIYDVMAPIVGGGFVGKGRYSNKTNRKAYVHWYEMLQRCGTTNGYEDKFVDDKWKCFQDFAEWAEAQVGFNHTRPTWQLDKDILIPGNKVYSEANCCFVPGRINGLLIRSNPKGNWYSKENVWRYTYREADSTKIVKSFLDKEAGQQWYSENKARVIAEVADVYKDMLDSRVYLALKSWQPTYGGVE